MKPRQTLTTKPRRSTKATSSSATIAAAGTSPNEPGSGNGDTLHELIAAEAYFCAERRGFTPGSELDDWLAAETIVDARMHEAQGSDSR